MNIQCGEKRQDIYTPTAGEAINWYNSVQNGVTVWIKAIKNIHTLI